MGGQRRSGRLGVGLIVACGVFVLAARGAVAGTAAGPVMFDDDAGTGVSTSLHYTHLLDFPSEDSPAAVINGVRFTHADTSGTTSGTILGGSFGWNLTAGFDAVRSIDSGSSDGGGVTLANVVPHTSGAYKLLSDFYFDGGTPTNGSSEVLTLSGLDPGTRYETRVYYRAWSDGGNRQITVKFDEGLDAPGVITVNEDGDPTHADYLQYDYTAGPSGTLTMTYTVSGTNPSGSWHDYGLTNAEGTFRRIPGDVNGDGAVDFTDLLALAQNYGEASGELWYDGDFNGDGKVDFADLLALAQNYSMAAGQAAQVPEPKGADAVFFALGLWGAVARRRRAGRTA